MFYFSFVNIAFLLTTLQVSESSLRTAHESAAAAAGKSYNTPWMLLTERCKSTNSP